LKLGFDAQTVWKAVVDNQGLGPSARWAACLIVFEHLFE
jgi:hypothetical protein